MTNGSGMEIKKWVTNYVRGIMKMGNKFCGGIMMEWSLWGNYSDGIFVYSVYIHNK